ncbi:MAG: zinc ion binding [Stictis urceolatum]|nr:zinc ion binding [Stictis urceolata]
MLAWTYTTRGPPRSVLHLTRTPSPALPKGTQVLLRISHVGFNWGMGYMMRLIPALPFLGRPWTPELEYSGTVVGVRARVSSGSGLDTGAGSVGVRETAGAGNELRECLVVGTRVNGYLLPRDILSGKGALAEFLLVDASCVFALPERVQGLEQGEELERAMVEAAALSGGAQTSLRMIDEARVQRGDRVLVNGASGSVGNMAVQILAGMGCRVVGVCSGGNEGLVKSLGKGKWVEGEVEVVDYTKFEGARGLAVESERRFGRESFDAVFDCVGSPELYDYCAGFLKTEGLYANIGAFEGIWRTYAWKVRGTWLPRWMGGGERRFAMFNHVPTFEMQAKVLRLWEEGKVKVLVDGVWAMGNVLDAYDRTSTKRARGKIVVKVQRDEV